MSSPEPALTADATYDSELVLQALLRGEADWVYEVTLPFAETGVADAQVMMGVLYETGLGVRKDGRAAIDWYKKAAIQDHPIAWSNLGSIYLLGLPGIPPNKKEAARSYARAQELKKKAAERRP